MTYYFPLAAGADMQIIFGPLAHLEERQTSNLNVVGSSPAGVTKVTFRSFSYWAIRKIKI